MIDSGGGYADEQQLQQQQQHQQQQQQQHQQQHQQQQQQNRRHQQQTHHTQQRLQAATTTTATATMDERGGGGGRQRHSENVAEQTDMAETGTRAADVVVVTAADVVKENRNGPSSSDVSVSAASYTTAAAEHVTSSQVQVSSIPVGQLINVSAAGTFNVISAESLQVKNIAFLSHRSRNIFVPTVICFSIFFSHPPSSCCLCNTAQGTSLS